MSGGVSNAPAEMTLQDFMRLYQPTALPVVQPQAAPLRPLGQSQPAQGSQGGGQGGGQRGGQGQGQQGGSLPFLGQLAQIGGGLVGLGPRGQAQQGQPAPAGIQGVLMNAMNSNGANGTSNMLADAVGYQPFGGGGWGSGA